jgi:hypothetical protein
MPLSATEFQDHLMHSTLSKFLTQFQQTFDPPPPARGESQTDWFISGVWSQSLKNWFTDHYPTIRYEFRVGTTRRWLDAALCHKANVDLDGANARMDLAVEWEWDNNKVWSQFGQGDFRKLFEVAATCGVAIVQTRVDRRRGTEKADDTITQLRELHKRYSVDCPKRDVAIVEFRRILHTPTEVRFDACYWLNGNDQPRPLGQWDYAVSRGEARRVERSGS